MNIAEPETQFIIEAKTCGCKDKRNITYNFIESSHNLCMDRKEILLAQLRACERLLKYAKEDVDLQAIQKEISDLKLILDMIRY